MRHQWAQWSVLHPSVINAASLSICGGGAGFFLACEDFRRMFDHSFPAYPFFFFFWGVGVVDISSRTLIPLFMQRSVHSGSAG